METARPNKRRFVGHVLPARTVRLRGALAGVAVVGEGNRGVVAGLGAALRRGVALPWARRVTGPGNGGGERYGNALNARALR